MCIFAAMANFVNIHAEKVPNPNAMKFTISNFLLSPEAHEFTDADSAKASPLAEKLFGFDYVNRVFIAKNFVTVNKSPEGPEWEGAMIDLRIVIKKHLEGGEALFSSSEAAPSEDSPSAFTLEKQIGDTIAQVIQPATWQDGGEIRFESFADGVVKVELAGACVGCPFAPRTIKHGVETVLKQRFPQVQSVTSDQVNWAETQQEESPTA